MNESELHYEIKRLEEIVSSALATIRCLHQQLAVLTADFKVGDRVYCENIVGATFEVVRIGWKYGRPIHYGQRVLKGGGLGTQVYELWGKIEPVQGGHV